MRGQFEASTSPAHHAPASRNDSISSSLKGLCLVQAQFAICITPLSLHRQTTFPDWERLVNLTCSSAETTREGRDANVKCITVIHVEYLAHEVLSTCCMQSKRSPPRQSRCCAGPRPGLSTMRAPCWAAPACPAPRAPSVSLTLHQPEIRIKAYPARVLLAGGMLWCRGTGSDKPAVLP